MKTKPFSCITLQHRGAEKIYEETQNLTIAEELAYWQQYTNKLQQRLPNEDVGNAVLPTPACGPDTGGKSQAVF